MILSLCSDANVLKILRYIKIVINIIFLIVPILLLVTASINYLKAMSNGDNDSIESLLYIFFSVEVLTISSPFYFLFFLYLFFYIIYYIKILLKNQIRLIFYPIFF